jgi:hypothetical protein
LTREGLEGKLRPRKAVHREGRQGREGKQSTNLVIKITNLAIASGFTLALISLASLASFAVQSFGVSITY